MNNKKWTAADRHTSYCGSHHGVSCAIANPTTHLACSTVTVSSAEASGTAPHRTRITSIFERIPGERLDHWSTDVRTTPYVRYSIPECKEKISTGYKGSNHKRTAQDQCRTARELSAESASGSRKLPAQCGHKCRFALFSGHLVRTLADLCVYPFFGFLHGINVSPKRNFNFGVIRTSCLIFIILHFCLLASVASARHRSRDLAARNQTHAADLDEMVEVLMRQGPSPPTVSKKGSVLRRLGRMGRTGRRRHRDSTHVTNEVINQIKLEMDNASCKPRDTIVDSFTVLNIDRGYDRLIPECIVVPRCRNGGCCLEHQECVTDQSVNKTVYFLRNGEYVLSKTIQVDTRCRCDEKQPYCGLTSADCSWPKVLNVDSCSCECPRKCPEPFLQNERCECDCLMSDKQCKNFFRGKRGATLSPSDCSCVLSNECIVPPCANGVFVIDKCRCINSLNSKR